MNTAAIQHNFINPKPYTWHGEKKQARETTNDYHATVIPGESITIYGIVRNTSHGPVEYRKTFKVGDVAVYGSFNMTYTGKITAIGKNTVTVDPGKGYSKKHRLDLYFFTLKNWDFDLEKITRRNAEWND